MDKSYLISQLKEIATLSGFDIDDSVIESAIGFSEFKIFSKSEILASAGDNAKRAGIVMSGLVRSFYVDMDGNDISQFFGCPGHFCMDSGMMGFAESQAMWEAIEDSTIMLFEVKRMKQLIMGEEKLKTLWIELLEGGMRYKVYRENGFLVENATERYIKFKKRYPELTNRVPLCQIATYLGIKPESLSRIRKAMKEDCSE